MAIWGYTRCWLKLVANSMHVGKSHKTNDPMNTTDDKFVLYRSPLVSHIYILYIYIYIHIYIYEWQWYGNKTANDGSTIAQIYSFVLTSMFARYIFVESLYIIRETREETSWTSVFFSGIQILHGFQKKHIVSCNSKDLSLISRILSSWVPTHGAPPRFARCLVLSCKMRLESGSCMGMG
jgi:hypothetical protein